MSVVPRKLYLKSGSGCATPNIVNRTNSDPVRMSGNRLVVSGLVHNAKSLATDPALTLRVQGSVRLGPGRPVVTPHRRQGC